MNKVKKYDWLDILRIISCFAVILLHCSCDAFSINQGIIGFTIGNFYNSISRFCVPIFLMITGALLLNPDKEIDIKKFTINKTLKIIIDLICWCIIYYIFKTIILNGGTITFEGLINSITNLQFHLWYMKALIFIYLFLPIVKLITNNHEKLIKYYIIAFLIFGVLLKSLMLLPLPSYIIDLLGFFREDNSFWYMGYVVLGYYLFSTNITKNKRLIIYVLGIISLISCFGLNELTYIKFHKMIYLNDYFSITTLFYSISIFVFIKYKFKDKSYNEINLRFIGDKTYGIYLIHIMIMNLYELLGFSTFSFNFIISIPIMGMSIFIASYIIIIIMKKIPIIRKIV